MAIQLAVQVGPQVVGDGAPAIVRGGRTGELVVQELHGRFYEQAYRNLLFSGGMTVTSISNATFTSATLGATCTPIAGVWNPGTSTVNLVILQAILGIIITASTATGCGPFVWAVSTGNNVLTLGGVPWNRRTLAQSGSQAKNMAGIALTGLTNNLVVMGGSALVGGQATSASIIEGVVAAPPTIESGTTVENLDGSLIIPPGGVLALLATATAVAHSAVSALLWEEVAL